DRPRRRRAEDDDWPSPQSATAVADGEHVPPGPPAPDLGTRTAGAGGSGFGAAEEHSRPQSATAGAEYAPQTGGGAEGEDDAEDEVTSKGLPKRTPRITAPAAPPRQRGTGVDADALRRRLGGFRRGADAGRRDVEAEIAEQTGQNQVPSVVRAVPGTAVSEEATGGTVEEASS
ncbi:histidine kinase, partial [Streptomyces sp. NPDC007901]